MDKVINSILDQIKAKHKINKGEAEKVLDSEFGFILNNMQSRSLKPMHLIHLGIISPTEFYKAYRAGWVKSKKKKHGNEQINKDSQGDITGVQG
jgi:hypothetical protein